MHCEKRDIETNEKQPEVPLSQSLIGHPARHFWKPEIEPGKHREHRATDQHIMKCATMKYVSCTWRSTGTEASMTPESPPIRNSKKKPKHHNMGSRNCRRPFQIVATQKKNCTPVGITIIKLAAVKKLSLSCGIPVANMWWTHTPKPMKPVATTDTTMGVYPRMRRRVKHGTSVDMIDAPGKKMM